MSNKQIGTDHIPLYLVSFSKIEQQKILQQLIQKIETEFFYSLDQIKLDKRWKQYLATILKQSNGSLVKLVELIESKQWVKNKYIYIIDQEQIIKQKMQIDFYQTKLKENHEEIQKRKLEKQNLHIKRKQKQQYNKRLKQLQKQKQEQQKELIAHQINQKPKKRIAIITQTNYSKQLANLKNNQTLIKKSNSKQLKLSGSSKSKSKNKNKNKQQQKIDKTIQSLPSQLQGKNKRNIYKIEDLINSIQSNKIDHKNKPRQLETLQLKDSDQQCLQSPKYQPLQEPNIPASRQYLIKKYLKEIDIKQTQQIKMYQQFEFKQNLLKDEIQFSESVNILKRIYEEKRQKYLDLEQRLSLLN